jgi:PST family polysaccharide transporter
MAWVEIAGDVVLAGVSIVLALAGLGVWAPVIGYISWQSTILVSSFVAAGYRPRILFRRAMAVAMLRYGFGFSASNLVYQANELSGPVVVGSLLGPHALGLAALASKIAESLCFVARATWRLSIVVFGRLQADAARLGRAVSEAMALQAVALAPILGGFAIFATLLVPAVFGDAWRPAVELLPPVMVGYLLTAVFNMEASLLYVRGESATMFVTNLVRIGLLFGVGFLLVPRLGTIGWAIAFGLHPIGFLVCIRRVDRLLPVSYVAVSCWLVASIPPLFAPYLPWELRALLLLPAIAICCTPWARDQLKEYARYVRAARRTRTTAAPSAA